MSLRKEIEWNGKDPGTYDGAVGIYCTICNSELLFNQGEEEDFENEVEFMEKHQHGRTKYHAAIKDIGPDWSHMGSIYPKKK